MKIAYSTPSTGIQAMQMEACSCVTASTAENEGFTPVPGLWDDMPTLPNIPML